MIQSANSVTAVTIVPKSGKSPGAVSNIRYEGSTTIPQTVGTYAVTFDVAAATGWDAVTGLSAGNLDVNNKQTPKPADYTIGNLTQTANSVTAVTVTPLGTASPGAVSNICYAGSATIPQTAGTYAVTFDVAAAEGWNAATNLSAGNLTVSGGSSGGDEGLLGKWYDSDGHEAFDFQSNGKLLTGGSDEGVSYRVSGNTFDILYQGTVLDTKTFVISGSGSTATLTISGGELDHLNGTLTRTVGGRDTLAKWLQGLQTTAQNNGNYEYTVTENEELAPQTLSYTGKSDITITLKADSPVTITRSNSGGRLFTIGSGVTLVLEDNLTLSGGGVEVNGTFTMNGGKISDSYTGSTSSSAYGGGVYVSNYGTFTMNGGEISGNTVNAYYSNGSGCGGGVYSSGTFTMNNGKISGNTATCADYATAAFGGGVYASAFTMNGGEISGNNATSGWRSTYGGGVHASTFTMTGGKISGNTAGSQNGDGGGVSFGNNGTFTMKGGEISGNSANGSGSQGGGVSFGSNGTFRIVTGTIYGTNETDTALRNSAGKGSALYANGSTAEYGTFSGETWSGTNIPDGSSGSFANTIKVVNGVLQP